MLIVVGLGPGEYKSLTLEALDALKSYPVYLRTSIHPVVDELREHGIAFTSFDELYERAEDFESLYKEIANKLVTLSHEKDIVYAVPGNPLFYEESVREVLALKGADVKVIAGLSFIDVVADAIGEKFEENFFVLDAHQVLAENFRPDFSYSILLSQVYNRYIVSEIKLKLMRYLPDDFEIALVKNAGQKDMNVKWIKLYELDREAVDHLTSLYIPNARDEFTDFNQFVETVRTLRMPGGCPWDREQTHQSLKRYMLEEAAEAVEAIENEDLINLEEELGDVLLEVVLQTQIADENGDFNIFDVIGGINEKMIRRHPHVFGDSKLTSSKEVLDSWESIKREEKATTSLSEEMQKIPQSLSALLKSDKIQDKARSVGFDWEDPCEALEKVSEEREEVEEALANGDNKHVLEEIGDLLFACVNVARLSGIDPEEALRFSNKKFVDRFEEMEKLARIKGTRLSEYTLDELEEMWELAKKINKGVSDE